jgi:hypothetical protein
MDDRELIASRGYGESTARSNATVCAPVAQLLRHHSDTDG